MIGAIGFVVGAAVMGIVWYVKDYTMDSLYCKGYKRGYDRAMVEKGDEGSGRLSEGE